MILTALPVEYQAVRAHLTDLHESEHGRGTVYERGMFAAENCSWEVTLAEVGAGNPSAAFELERAVTQFDPQVVFFVGVAGGIKDVRLGDVVAATKVYGYESGKATSDFLPRADVGNTSYRLEQRARSEARHGDWLKRIPEFVSPPEPAALVGPIAAGEKVVASTRSSVYTFLRRAYGDAIAVEMEGRGFLEAAHANQQVDALVIRGISDQIHGKSTADAQGWQLKAARHAAAFAYQILSKLEPHSGPKARPAAWRVPHHRNQNFTGRDDLLSRLHSSFRLASSSNNIQVLYGLGAIGKTQIALEYVYRHRSEYDIIWWMPADDLSQVGAALVELAVHLAIPMSDVLEINEVIEALFQQLMNTDRWLLVFDNADDTSRIRKLLPSSQAGHVLVTSRNPNWRSMATSVEVREFSPSESVRFLHNRTGRDDEPDADALSVELGNLPLALEQAGSYIEETGSSYLAYLALLRTTRPRLLQRLPNSTDYPQSVATTWTLSIDKVAELSPEAVGLLRIFSYLAPDDIPISVLLSTGSRLPATITILAQDPFVRTEWRAALRRYSLVNFGDEAVAVHRLVQAVVRDSMSRDEQRQWAGDAIELMFSVFPAAQHDVTTWQTSARLVPHALSVVAHGTMLQVKPAAILSLLNNVASYFLSRGLLADAAFAWERSRAVARQAYGNQSAAAAVFSNHLGEALLRLGQPRVALPYLTEALTIEGAIHGRTSPIISRRYNSVGSAYQALGDFTSARKFRELALEIADHSPDPNLHDLAIIHNDLGVLLSDLADYSGSKDHYRQAVAASQVVHGPLDPEVATHLGNLGILLLKMGEHGEARDHLERARSILVHAYGEDHPSVAVASNNLGGYFETIGEYSKAKDEFVMALEIDRHFHGRNHPLLAIRHRNIGRVLLELEQAQDAVPHFEEAIKIDEHALSPDHPDFAKSLGGLGDALRQTGNAESAKELLSRALEIDVCIFGENHPNVSGDLNNLALALRDLGDLNGVREKMMRAVSIDEADPSTRQVQIVHHLGNLAVVLEQLQDKTAAKDAYARAAMLGRTVLRSNDPRLAHLLGRYGLLCIELGAVTEGRSLLIDARAIFVKVLGPEHPYSVSIQQSLDRIGVPVSLAAGQ